MICIPKLALEIRDISLLALLLLPRLDDMRFFFNTNFLQRNSWATNYKYIIPNTLVGPPPQILFFSPSPEHKNGGFNFSAARPPYRLYLGLWMETTIV
jgi:hypothetical protein